MLKLRFIFFRVLALALVLFGIYFLFQSDKAIMGSVAFFFCAIAAYVYATPQKETKTYEWEENLPDEKK